MGGRPVATWTVCASDLSVVVSAGEYAERYVTIAGANGLTYGRADRVGGCEPALRPPRAAETIKPTLFPPKQEVARYARDPERVAAEVAPPRRLLVGARACELRATAYLDRVFRQPPVSDPFYTAYREAETIISVDCVEPHASCFCNLVDGRPYATEGFDLNLTPIDGKYVVEAGTEAGRELAEAAGAVLTEATEDDLAARDRVRREVTERLESQNAEYAPARPPAAALAAAEDEAIWDTLAVGCVECGACTQICPTCHCFYLADRTCEDGVFARMRAWDSCIWSGYSRMAGAPGAKPNPRSRFRSRFANRFLHKYVWSPQQWEMLGCVGCGRCIEGCPGRIDLRQVVAKVSS
jgi:sulfhydrogenase subunit beta (sulfur reductase)